MGYYTKYKLTVEPAELTEAIDRELTEEAYGEGHASVFDDEKWNGGMGCKWYSVVEDMATISARHPGVTITVEGRGEAERDHWKRVMRDGVEVEWVNLAPPAEEDDEW